MTKATKPVKKAPKHPLVAAIFGPTRRPPAVLNDDLPELMQAKPGEPKRPTLEPKPAPARVIPSEPPPRPRKRRRKNKKHPIVIQIEKREREIAKLRATAAMLGINTTTRTKDAKPTGRARKANIAAKLHAPL